MTFAVSWRPPCTEARIGSSGTFYPPCTAGRPDRGELNCVEGSIVFTPPEAVAVRHVLRLPRLASRGNAQRIDSQGAARGEAP